MRNKIFLAIAATVSILCACNKPVTNPETPDDPTTPPAQAQAVYVKGFRIESIYLTNLFYRVELTGSTKMGGDTKLAKTDYSSIKLNKTNIPYVMFLASPAKIGDMHAPNNCVRGRKYNRKRSTVFGRYHTGKRFVGQNRAHSHVRKRNTCNYHV